MTTAQEKEEFRQHKDDIKDAAKDAIRLIADANASAVKLISDAASQATKVLSDTAIQAAKVLTVKNEGDHDLLTRLQVLMEGLKEDIKDLKSGTSMKIEDHETRIKALERKTSNYTITIVLYSSAVVSMIALIIYHILQR